MIIKLEHERALAGINKTFASVLLAKQKSI